MKTEEMINKIRGGVFDVYFKLMYGENSEIIESQRKRYINAVSEFSRIYPEKKDIHIFSAPGRTEIGGNHTDHQHGCVLAAAVDLDVIAVVSPNDGELICIKSEGYKQSCINASKLNVVPEEKGTSNAIIRGIVAGFAKRGVKVKGFDAYTTSNVMTGSGLSSSAAFEVLVGTVIDQLFNGGEIGAEEIARIGQFAENEYFGKKSGLMDQMVSSVGGLVFIDFYDTEKPAIKKINYDFEKVGFSICITDTKGSHANLTQDYVDIPEEMLSVARWFGKDYLRDVKESEFYSNLPELRKKCSDRAILRAAHFFSENRRAQEEYKALEDNRISEFIKLVHESGESSAQLLQNLYSTSNPTSQAIPLALMLSKREFASAGAVRVHGGGFAGTIQAFVMTKYYEKYINEMDRIFGKGSCHKLFLRPVGGVKII